MSASPATAALRQAVLETKDLDRLIAAIRDCGFQVIGPVVRDGAIAYEPIGCAADLPAGYVDEQGPGHYRLRREGARTFGYTVGATSWKRWLSPPRARMWRARSEGRAIEIVEGSETPARYALFGVRACELAAIAIQDRVYLGGPWTDPIYRARREQAFIVAAQCTRAGETCFCASTGSGPRASAGYDIALTEIVEADRHYFLAEGGSERGEEILHALELRASGPGEAAAAERAGSCAEVTMGRRLETDGLPEILRHNPEHPRWNDVAKRCMACGNCTQVCPTCFCTSVVDVAALGGGTGERIRRWDSCFAPEFSYIHGGSVRASVRSRYRQWLTHKLGTWQAQFGTPGCVGCGRCITWCPAGIDLTEEAAAIRAGAPREE